MIFEGLNPAALWPIFGWAAAALVALYLLRPRRRQVRVPFAKLWTRVAPPGPASALFRALQRFLSLLIQLAVAALLVLAMGRPQWTEGASIGEGCRPLETPPAPPLRHTALIIDTTASLGALDVPGSRLIRALDAGKNVIDAMQPGERLLLATAAGDLNALTGFTSHQETLSRALALRVRPEPRAGALTQVIPGIQALLADRENAQVVVVTDGDSPPIATDAFGEIPWSAIVVAPEQDRQLSNNLAISAFEARPYLDDPLNYELFVRIDNLSQNDAEATLVLYSAEQGRTSEEVRAGGAPFRTQPMKLGPNESRTEVLTDLTVPGERVLAVLKPKAPNDGEVRDPFLLDNEALALLPQRRRFKVALVSEGNLFLEAALMVRDHVTYERIEPERWAGEGSAKLGDYDFVIFDRWLPAGPLSPGQYLLIAPPAAASPVPVEGQVEFPEFTKTDERHPVLWKVSLGDLNVGSMQKLKPTAQDRILVATSAGDAAIVVRESDDGVRFALWAFEVGQTDLPLRYAFPLLLVNTLGWLHAEDNSLLAGERVGEEWAVALRSKDSRPLPASIRVERPDGKFTTAPVAMGRALIYGDIPGFWTIDPGGEHERVVAASFRAPTESALLASTEPWPIWTPPPPPPPKPPAPLLSGAEVWKLALLLALCVLALEWFTYHRRITV